MGSKGVRTGMEKKGVLAGNTATGTIKWIALIFMMIDHSGKMLFPGVPEMRMLGRIAFPLYCWALVVGCEFTSSMPRYLLRILITGVISQPLYMIALNHTWQEPSVFLTLFLAMLGLWGIREKKWGSFLWAPLLSISLATVLGADYGWRGVVLMILLYAAQSDRGAIAAVMVAFFLFWGTSYSVTKSFFGLPINLSALPSFLSDPLSCFLRMETYALLSLPFILIPIKKDLRMPRWIGYALYPAHLLLIMALKAILL